DHAQVPHSRLLRVAVPRILRGAAHGGGSTFTRSGRPGSERRSPPCPEFDHAGRRPRNRVVPRSLHRAAGHDENRFGRCRVRDERTLHERVQASPEFAELRSRLRRFVFPMSAAFMLWYLGYVLMASYAPEVMGIPVFGHINVGILVGLLQFASTFVITGIYVRFADAKLDPVAESIRTRLEGH